MGQTQQPTDRLPAETSTSSSDACPFGPDLQRYWDNRRALFSRFDRGIQIDREGLYSVKPEEAALEIGRILVGETVLDAFTGVGGSAIAFARSGKRVITIDIDESRLRMAQHNAAVYDVLDKITFLHGDTLDLIHTQSFDSVYLDPSWGGPSYALKPWFPLADFTPNGNDLLRHIFPLATDMAFTLPLNFDMREFVQFHRDCSVRWTKMSGNFIFSTAYFN
jgi:trimethylguanosine synthase